MLSRHQQTVKISILTFMFLFILFSIMFATMFNGVWKDNSYEAVGSMLSGVFGSAAAIASAIVAIILAIIAMRLSGLQLELEKKRYVVDLINQKYNPAIKKIENLAVVFAQIISIIKSTEMFTKEGISIEKEILKNRVLNKLEELQKAIIEVIKDETAKKMINLNNRNEDTIDNFVGMFEMIEAMIENYEYRDDEIDIETLSNGYRFFEYISLNEKVMLRMLKIIGKISNLDFYKTVKSLITSETQLLAELPENEVEKILDITIYNPNLKGFYKIFKPLFIHPLYREFLIGELRKSNDLKIAMEFIEIYREWLINRPPAGFLECIRRERNKETISIEELTEILSSPSNEIKEILKKCILESEL